MDGALNGQTVRSFEGPEGNQYEQLKVLREEERLSAIKQGLIDDPNHPKALEEAKLFLGTCTDMCPRFEREQREYQNNVERWELDPATGRIDARRAVKAFHRPAAGNEQALPSDVRPPHVLISTLDYLFDDIMCGGYPLEVTHGFIRDRTRSIRQDFTLQNNRGSEAILCHERIARFHILSLHLMRNVTGFSEQQETEQLRKSEVPMNVGLANKKLCNLSLSITQSKDTSAWYRHSKQSFAAITSSRAFETQMS
jgi:hypothetical protein